MIGILSAPQPFRTTQTLLAGAYASRGPGEVHRILTSFSFLDMELSVDGTQVDQQGKVLNFRQALDMRRAAFTTSFEYEDKLDVSYTLRALRQMPHTAMLEVTLSARKPVSIAARSRLEPSQMIERVERLESDLPIEHASLIKRKFFAARGTAVGGKLEAAAGHIFWDAELWMFPPLLMLRPELAREMLDYRFARLEAATRNARAFGYRGALFPWESVETGEEDTPLEALSGVMQHHISADIGIAAWNYRPGNRSALLRAAAGLPPGWQSLTMTGVGPEKRSTASVDLSPRIEPSGLSANAPSDL